jgi:hypothetical protein
MAKFTIDTTHKFTTGRGETETVAEALAWAMKHLNGEDEETGEETVAYTPADLIVYAVRRLRALNKDGKRHASGKLASRLYAPRLDNVEKAPRGVVEAVATLDAIQEKLNGESKPATKAAPTKAPKGSPARGAQVKAKHEAKQARKAAAKHDAGGAAVEF